MLGCSDQPSGGKSWSVPRHFKPYRTSVLRCTPCLRTDGSVLRVSPLPKEKVAVDIRLLGRRRTCWWCDVGYLCADFGWCQMGKSLAWCNMDKDSTAKMLAFCGCRGLCQYHHTLTGSEIATGLQLRRSKRTSPLEQFGKGYFRAVRNDCFHLPVPAKATLRCSQTVY